MMIFNNILKTIVLFFIVCANFKNVNSSAPQLTSVQYDILVNLTTNIGQTAKYSINSTLGYIDFCDQIVFFCFQPVGANYQIIENIYLENTAASTYILTGADFIDLSKITYMRLSNFKIDQNLASILYETVNYLFYYDCEMTSLVGYFPQFFYITQNTKAFSTSLQVSQLINSIWFTLNETDNSNLINVNLVNDLLPGESVSPEEIIVTLNDLPDLTNVNTELFSMEINNHFTSTPTYGNLGTFSLVEFLSISCDISFASTLNFSPFNLMTSSSISTVMFSACNFINVPTSLNFPNLPSLTGVGLNDPFDSFDDVDDIIPITNNNINQFSYVNGKLPNFNNIARFYNYDNVALQNNQINSVIPDFDSDQSNINIINLSENGLTGTISETWCSVNLIARNNSLSGLIPNCMKCYWNYMSYNLDGNNGLTNFYTNEECTTLVPNVYFNKTEGYLYVFGTSLGFQYPFLVDESTTNFFICETVTINSKFKCLYDPNEPTPSLLQLEHMNGRNFTFSVEPAAPLVSNVTVLSIVNTTLSTVTEYQFNGLYFGYNVSVTSVTIGGEQCTILINSDTSFYSINCTVTTPVNAPGLQLAVVQPTINSSIIPGNWHIIQVAINGLQQEFTIDNSLAFNPVIPCTKKCGRYCDFQIGLCVSNCLDPTCNGGKGVCNEDEGVCICKVDYAGANCTIINQFASSVIEAPQSGGQVILTGVFGDVWAGQSVTINGSTCAITNSTSTTITCTIGALIPGKLSVTIIQNGITWTGPELYILIPTVLSCLNNCNGVNGVCNTTTTQCKCNKGWYGLDCSSPFNPDTDNSDDSGSSGIVIPPTNSTVNNNGSTSINNEKTNYQISIPLLIELDLNKQIVQSYPLLGNWALKTNSQNTYTFGQTITQSTIINGTNSFVVSYTIQEITTSKSYSFAGYELDLEPGSVKISVAITNYQYLSSLNSLQLQFYSTVATISDDGGECNDKDTTIGNNNQQITNYINIQRDSKTLQARFLNRIESDGRATTISSEVVQTTANSITVGLNLPHCSNCYIDPDFSVLISPDFKSDCGDDAGKRAAYVIPVSVVASVVGVSTIGIVTYYIIKKRRDAKLFKSLSSRSHD